MCSHPCFLIRRCRISSMRQTSLSLRPLVNCSPIVDSSRIASQSLSYRIWFRATRCVRGFWCWWTGWDLNSSSLCSLSFCLYRWGPSNCRRSRSFGSRSWSDRGLVDPWSQIRDLWLFETFCPLSRWWVFPYGQVPSGFHLWAPKVLCQFTTWAS